MTSSFTVFHDGQFWVGIYEIHQDDKVRATRVIFGKEPTDQQIYEFLNAHGVQIIDKTLNAASVANASSAVPKRKIRNPKRIQREAARAAKQPRLSTMAQEALKADLHSRKIKRKSLSKEQREQEANIKRQKKRAKAKAKHRGH